MPYRDGIGFETKEFREDVPHPVQSGPAKAGDGHP